MTHMNDNTASLCVYLGDALGDYAFGGGHPFGPERYPAFKQAFAAQGLDERCHIQPPVMADAALIERFHTPDYVHRVRRLSKTGAGLLDYGDTPAFKGVYEAAATVVGTTLDGVARVMNGECSRAFTPIGGLHHAARDRAAGFCVFNDCGVAIEALLGEYRLERVAYVDIDAHHGDGVFYAFEADPRVIFADIHQDGRTIYPGTGHAEETGKGPARGAKLNIPLLPGAGDRQFMESWDLVMGFLRRYDPQFILLQCGADSLAGDPITQLRFSADAHAHAAQDLRELSNECCEGRLLAMGGGGYNLDNIAAAWTAVVEQLV